MNYNDKKVLFSENFEKFETERRKPENCHHLSFRS